MLTGGSLSPKALWERVKVIAKAYYVGVTTALAWLMVMMSCVQMAVCMISLTGFGVKVSELIIAVGHINIYLALVLTMVTALLLGMGMPTTAAYVIAAAVIVPALMKIGAVSFSRTPVYLLFCHQVSSHATGMHRLLYSCGYFRR